MILFCHMDCFDLSAHASREELVDFAVGMSPRAVILGHGEPEARDWIEAELRGRLPRLNILQPCPGESIEV